MSGLFSKQTLTEGIDSQKIGSPPPVGGIGIQKNSGETGFFIHTNAEYSLWLKDSLGVWVLYQTFTSQNFLESSTFAWGEYDSLYIQTANPGHIVYFYPRYGALLIDGNVGDGQNVQDTLISPGGSAQPNLVTAPIEQFPNWSNVNGHIIPDTNSAFDIGSAENKVRHLFLSDNSLWIGDDNKISVSGGKLKTRTRKKDVVPANLQALGVGPGSADLLDFQQGRAISDLSIGDWVQYARQKTGDDSVSAQMLYSPGDFEDDVDPGFIESRGLMAAGLDSYPQSYVMCVQDPDEHKEDHVNIRAGGSNPQGYAQILVGKSAYADVNVGINDGEIGAIGFVWKSPSSQEKRINMDNIFDFKSDIDSMISKEGAAINIMQINADALRVPSLTMLPASGSEIKNEANGGNLRILNNSPYSSISDFALVIASTLDDPMNEEEPEDNTSRVLKLAMSENPIPENGVILWDSIPSGDPLNPGSIGPTVTNDRFLVCSSNSNTSGGGGTLRYYIDGLGRTSDSLTVQHWVVYEALSESVRLENISPGMILRSTGSVFNKTMIEQALPIVSLANSSNDKAVYGVLSSDFASGFDLDKWDEFDRDFNTKSKRLGDSSDDLCQYSEDSMYYKARTNSGGEGMIWVTNIGGNLENGDYVTTSEIPGYGKLQSDDVLHNYTVAKVVENIDWEALSSSIEHDGQSYKAALVACTYHCG